MITKVLMELFREADGRPPFCALCTVHLYSVFFLLKARLPGNRLPPGARQTWTATASYRGQSLKACLTRDWQFFLHAGCCIAVKLEFPGSYAQVAGAGQEDYQKYQDEGQTDRLNCDESVVLRFKTSWTSLTGSTTTKATRTASVYSKNLSDRNMETEVAYFSFCAVCLSMEAQSSSPCTG